MFIDKTDVLTRDAARRKALQTGDFTKLTPLELVDYISDKLIKQNRQSATEYCLYRGPEGLKCAAGHIIPDNRYRPDMEGTMFDQINDEFGLGFSPEQTHIILECQRIHDHFGPANWPTEFANLRTSLSE